MMTDKLNINQWAVEDRPREKLLVQGARALSDAELLAILIGSGTADENAVELMRRILNDCGGSLQALGRMRLDDFTAYKGVGPAKAVCLMAACELGNRRMKEPTERKRIESSRDIADFFQPMLMELPHEECHVMMLRNNLTLKGTFLVGRGGITESAVDIRLILEAALRNQSTAIVLCHNHPSGSLTPSTMDKNLTRQLAEACRIMNIRLLDHVIVSDQGYFSFKDQGLMD